MSFTLEQLSEGIRARHLGAENNRLIEKWTKTGLLRGLNGVNRESMARLLENQASHVIKEASSLGNGGNGALTASGDMRGFTNVAFPIVRRVFGGLIANDLVSIQPMSLPSGLLFYLDYTRGGDHGVGDPISGQSNSIYDKGSSLYNNPTGSAIRKGSNAVAGQYDLAGTSFSRAHGKRLLATADIAAAGTVLADGTIGRDIDGDNGDRTKTLTATGADALLLDFDQQVLDTVAAGDSHASGSNPFSLLCVKTENMTDLDPTAIKGVALLANSGSAEGIGGGGGPASATVTVLADSFGDAFGNGNELTIGIVLPAAFVSPEAGQNAAVPAAQTTISVIIQDFGELGPGNPAQNAIHVDSAGTANINEVATLIASALNGTEDAAIATNIAAALASGDDDIADGPIFGITASVDGAVVTISQARDGDEHAVGLTAAGQAHDQAAQVTLGGLVNGNLSGGVDDGTPVHLKVVGNDSKGNPFQEGAGLVNIRRLNVLGTMSGGVFTENPFADVKNAATAIRMVVAGAIPTETIEKAELDTSGSLVYPRASQLSTGNGDTLVVPSFESDFNGANPQPSIPEIDIKVEAVPVVAETRKLRARWSPELAQDLNAYHSLDAEVELTQILSEQIALEIDREILSDLLTGASAANFFWSRAPGKFVNKETAEDGPATASFTGTVREWYETLVETIIDVANQIHRKTLRGSANFIVCGPDVATILEASVLYKPSYSLDGDGQVSAPMVIGADRAGTLSNRFTVYKDPYFPRNKILVGYKGGSYLETGFVYAPYVPLIVTPTIFQPEDFTPRKGVMTRYGKKMVRADFYGTVTCLDMNII